MENTEFGRLGVKETQPFHLSKLFLENMNMAMCGVPELLYMPYIKYVSDWPINIVNKYVSKNLVTTFMKGRQSCQFVTGLYD